VGVNQRGPLVFFTKCILSAFFFRPVGLYFIQFPAAISVLIFADISAHDSLSKSFRTSSGMFLGIDAAAVPLLLLEPNKLLCAHQALC